MRGGICVKRLMWAGIAQLTEKEMSVRTGPLAASHCYMRGRSRERKTLERTALAFGLRMTFIARVADVGRGLIRTHGFFILHGMIRLLVSAPDRSTLGGICRPAIHDVLGIDLPQ